MSGHDIEHDWDCIARRVPAADCDCGAALERPDEPEWRCAECGSIDVQVRYPVWMEGVNVDDRARWEPDFEATPAGHCRECDRNDRAPDVLKAHRDAWLQVARVEVEDAPDAPEKVEDPPRSERAQYAEKVVPLAPDAPRVNIVRPTGDLFSAAEERRRERLEVATRVFAGTWENNPLEPGETVEEHIANDVHWSFQVADELIRQSQEGKS